MTIKKVEKDSKYKVVDSQNCGLPNFPSSSKQACKDFEKFLTDNLSEGWEYVGSRVYSVGVELSRQMHIFKRSQ